jgi:hypothetical protein
MIVTSMQSVSLLHIHIPWNVQICQAFWLKILSVPSGMRLRENTTPESTAVDSNDHYNSVLRTIVLPILGGFALTAISLAILYAFFKHCKQKRKGKATATNQQVLTQIYC